ncbi:AMP-binding protein [Flocculibacter collagenilyticus]|uniref:AMP-binding protein n=1 Tax=Flocculibacter collagenilyticus TaxID=2744479 RepID=UPI0018F7C1BA|nr:AMP-binding protein [Flocculibacter collagenilyticus]
MATFDQLSDIKLAEHETLIQLLNDTFEKYSNKPAFHCLGQTLTFNDIDQKSKAVAAWFQENTTLKQGDRIAIQLPNLIQFPIVAYAAIRCGYILVNTNPLYTPREMQHQFSNSNAKMLITLTSNLSKFEEIADHTGIEYVITTSPTDLIDLKNSSSIKAESGTSVSNKPFNLQTLTNILVSDCTANYQQPQSNNQNDIALLQYTGGTTGPAKAASLSQANVLSNVKQSYSRLGDACKEGEEVFACPLPVYHIYAFTVNLLLFFSRGNLNVLIPNPRDMDAFINTLSQFKITGISGINTLFVGLCYHPNIKQIDFTQLHFSLSGGTTLTPIAAKLWKETTGCTITEGYGLSETSPVLTLNPPGHEVIGSVGLPLVGTEIEIWDDNGKPVAQGEEGELVARGPQIMLGYWQNEEATSTTITPNGWLKTGDIAVKLNNGYIKIVDRKKDMIIVSGFNVYPNEVEAVLTMHDEIAEAAVIGEADDHSGECVVAYVVAKAGAEVTAQAIIDFCKTQLTGYKVPKKVNLVSELPKSSVGKILRKDLRK